ncbi:hypothetical protein ACFQI7_13250 [Paenibacillus allorhizosphaerae]
MVQNNRITKKFCSDECVKSYL